jgi:hypothetical protein
LALPAPAVHLTRTAVALALSAETTAGADMGTDADVVTRNTCDGVPDTDLKNGCTSTS